MPVREETMTTNGNTYRTVLDKYWQILLIVFPASCILIGLMGAFINQNLLLIVLPIGILIRFFLGLLKCPKCGFPLQPKKGFASDRCKKCGAD